MLVEDVGDEAKDAVADAVAIGVVDPLEMVDVADRDAHGHALAGEILQLFLEGAAIGQVGQRVPARLLAGFGQLDAQRLRLVAGSGELALGRFGALDHRLGDRGERGGAAVLLELGDAGLEVAAIALRLGARAFDHRREIVHLAAGGGKCLRAGRARLGAAAMCRGDLVDVALAKPQAVAGGGADRGRDRRILAEQWAWTKA